MAANILADAFQVALLINTCSLTKGLPFTVDHIGVHKSNYACGWTACGLRGLPQASRFALISHIRSHTGETRPTSRWGGLKLHTRSPFTQSTLEVDGQPPIPTVDTDVYSHAYAYPLAKQLSPIAELDSFSPISTASDGADSSKKTSRWGGLKLHTRSPFTQSTLEVDGLKFPSPPDTLSNHLRTGVIFPLASQPPIPTVDTDIYSHAYAYPLAKQLSPIAEWDSFSPISTASDGADSSEESTPSNSNPGSSGPTAGFEDTSKFS